MLALITEEESVGIAAVEVEIGNTEGVLVEIDMVGEVEEVQVEIEDEAGVEIEKEEMVHPQVFHYPQTLMWMVQQIKSIFHLL